MLGKARNFHWVSLSENHIFLWSKFEWQYGLSRCVHQEHLILVLILILQSLFFSCGNCKRKWMSVSAIWSLDTHTRISFSIFANQSAHVGGPYLSRCKNDESVTYYLCFDTSVLVSFHNILKWLLSKRNLSAGFINCLRAYTNSVLRCLHTHGHWTCERGNGDTVDGRQNSNVMSL